MCSLGDDAFDDAETAKFMPIKAKLSPSDKCNKCKDRPPCVVLRSKDRYCKECFLAGTVHKFKALLGKHRVIRPKDRVLVVHKGGHPSTALLHFIRSGLNLDTHKKLRFEPVVLFIENHSHLALEERRNLVERIENEAAEFNFPINFTSIAQIVSNKVTVVSKSELLDLDSNDKTTLNAFLKLQGNRTNKTDYLQVITRNYLIKVAKELNCSSVFTPELSNDVAAQLLTDISLGRGANAPLNTGFCDSRDETVKILRPLRLFDTKELVFYNYFNKLQPVTYRQPREVANDSVQSLMRKFVVDLQVNYPATITTILKTGDKLATVDASANKCELCNAPLDGEAAQLNSAESTSFSHWVSTRTPDVSATPQERYETILETFTNRICDKYCFACRKLATSN